MSETPLLLPRKHIHETHNVAVAQLAQAQEIAVAKVQPLHVNLPLRGLRYAFTQVLQTEVNKPMTIHLSASNTKTGHWLGRIGMGLVGFLALWAVVAVVAARKRA